MTLKDHLTQAAEDVVTMLTQHPNNTVPSLKAGDPTRNAVLRIAKLLKRVENIPEPVEDQIQENDIVAPRVKQIPHPVIKNSQNPITTPNSIPFNSDELSIDVLKNYSNMQKNLRFQN